MPWIPPNLVILMQIYLQNYQMVSNNIEYIMSRNQIFINVYCHSFVLHSLTLGAHLSILILYIFHI